MSDFTVDYVVLPTLGAVVAYAILLTIVLLAVGNGWLRKWK